MNATRRADLAVILRRQVMAAEYALERAIIEHGAESWPATRNAEHLAFLRRELRVAECDG